MDIPAELPVADPHTNAELQGNLLQDYEHKFEQLPEDRTLSNLCSDAGLKIVEKGQFFISLLNKKDHMTWRIYVESTRCFEAKKHPEWEGGFSETRRSAQSWMWRSVIIQNATVTKSWSNLCFETEQFLGFELWMELTNTWPQRQKPFLLKALSPELKGNLLRRLGHNQSLPWHSLPISVLIRERKLDRQERFLQGCFTVSNMIRLLRHDASIHREDDGAVRFDDIMEEIKAKFDGTSQWPFGTWITSLAQGGEPKKRFQYCLNPNSSKHFLYFRAIQGHAGGSLVDPALEDNVLLPEDFTEKISHVGNASEIHSMIRSGLILGGRSLKRDRQSVLFTAVNPMDDDQSMEEIRCDLDKPRIAPYKNTWRPHQNTVYWWNLNLAQKKGLQFLSNTITRNRSLQHIACD